jgi:hypothetical protein
MSLDKIVRDTIQLAKRAAGDLVVTVQYEPWVDTDGYGQRTYGTTEERVAIVDFRRQKFTTEGSSETVQAVVVTFLDPFVANGAEGRQEPVDPRDRVTLPDGTVAPIVEVRGAAVDPTTNQPFMIEVVLGKK